MYAPSDQKIEQVNNAFRYHRPTEGQPKRYEEIRDFARHFAMLILTTTPESREQSIALIKLEEAVMFANAAIARNEGN